MVLIDGEPWAEFMLDHDVSVSKQERYVVTASTAATSRKPRSPCFNRNEAERGRSPAARASSPSEPSCTP